MGLTAPPEPLTTERIVLEPLRVAHVAEMMAVLDDPELHRYTGGEPLTLEELRNRYAVQVTGRSADGSQRWFNWIIRDSGSRAAVGFVQATVEVASGVADVAWVVGTGFQGRGYAREAASLMVSWLRDAGVTALTAHIHPANNASQSVARALEFHATSTVRRGEVVWKSS